MNEDKNGGTEAADEKILDLLEARAGGSPEQALPFDAAREYAELLGILPRALPEVSPGAGVKQRILEAVVQEASSRQSARDPRDPRASALPSGRPRWLMPLAASLAIAMMAVTGWLVIEVRDQRLLIAELSEQLEGARSMAEAFSTSQAHLARARSRLAMATTRGAEFCALSPPEGSPAEGARGVLVMHAAQEEWFLRIEGLAPCPAGRKYVVWFATPRGRVPGPAFVAQDGEPVEITITDRPEDIRAIMITLESEPAPQVPSMEPLLFGNERVKLL